MMMFLSITIILSLLVNIAAFTSINVNSFNRVKLNNRETKLQMSGKMSKFGIFSPAVYAAKFVLGEAKLNKV
jgi:K+-transporting ATPase A subunit